MMQFLQLLANIDIDGFNMAIYCKNIVLQYYNFVNNNIVILFLMKYIIILTMTACYDIMMQSFNHVVFNYYYVLI